MFKQISIIRQRVLEVVENRLREMEAEYEQAKSVMLERHEVEVNDLIDKQTVEHSELVDGFVDRIVSKIL